MNKDLLLSYLEYDPSAHRRFPFFWLTNGKQILYYFGSSHSHNPKHPQVDLIIGYWNRFLGDTAKTGRVVLVENRQQVNHCKTIEKAVNEAGEAGLASYLALQEGVAVFCPEPSVREEVGYLASKYSLEYLLTYYFARGVYSWHLLDREPDLNDYLKQFLAMCQREYGTKGLQFDLDKCLSIYEKIFNKAFEPLDREAFYSMVDPTQDNNQLNEIARSIGVFRNYRILDQIKEHWERGSNLFIVYGRAHAIMQEPVLRDFIQVV
jgi:hypothetical protein